MENINDDFGLYISSIHGIAKNNPECLNLILTDFDLELVLKDLDEKMMKSYRFYKNHRKDYLFNGNGTSKALMQLNGKELIANYKLYLIYHSIASERCLGIRLDSDIDAIDIVYRYDSYSLNLR